MFVALHIFVKKLKKQKHKIRNTRTFGAKEKQEATTKPRTKTSKLARRQVRWRLNISRCANNRSPCLMCSQSAGAKRHRATSNMLRASLLLHMPTACYRSTARLLMLIPFGAPCTKPRRQTNTVSYTPFVTLTCDMCKTRAQNTHEQYFLMFFCYLCRFVVFWYIVVVFQRHVFLMF